MHLKSSSAIGLDLPIDKFKKEKQLNSNFLEKDAEANEDDNSRVLSILYTQIK